MTGLLPDYTVQQYKDGVAYFQQDVAAPLGLTTVFDPLMYVGSNGVQALEEMASDGDLAVRFRAALSLTPEDDLATWIPAAKAERAKHRARHVQDPGRQDLRRRCGRGTHRVSGRALCRRARVQGRRELPR